jgi:hypothetical protein
MKLLAFVQELADAKPSVFFILLGLVGRGFGSRGAQDLG